MKGVFDSTHIPAETRQSLKHLDYRCFISVQDRIACFQLGKASLLLSVLTSGDKMISNDIFRLF